MAFSEPSVSDSQYRACWHSESPELVQFGCTSNQTLPFGTDTGVLVRSSYSFTSTMLRVKVSWAGPVPEAMDTPPLPSEMPVRKSQLAVVGSITSKSCRLLVNAAV